MTWLDWVLLLALAFSIISGLMRGLIKTVFGLAGLVVGLLLAGKFYAVLAPSLSFIPQENLARIAAFVIIVAVVGIIASVLGAIFKKIADLMALGLFDRLGGGVLGLAISVLSLGAALALLLQFPVIDLGPTIGRSWLANLLLKTWPLVQGLLPFDFDALRKLPQA